MQHRLLGKSDHEGNRNWKKPGAFPGRPWPALYFLYLGGITMNHSWFGSFETRSETSCVAGACGLP